MCFLALKLELWASQGVKYCGFVGGLNYQINVYGKETHQILQNAPLKEAELFVIVDFNID